MTFRWKDYRAQGKTHYKTMTLSTEEFMRSFLLHVLPSGLHRIRHYGPARQCWPQEQHRYGTRATAAAACTDVQSDAENTHTSNRAVQPAFICRHYGAPMIIIDTFTRAQNIRAPSLRQSSS